MALIEAEKEHLAELLVAIQRCTYFLYASDRKIPWPLTESYLDLHQKDEPLFESIAAINERFGKLRDALGAAMRHATIIAAEPVDSFLRVLAFYASNPRQPYHVHPCLLDHEANYRDT